MKADHIVEALTGDSGWQDMIPQVNSSDFPTQWVPSAYECSIIDAQAKEIEKLRGHLRHLCRDCDLDRLEELAEADRDGRVVVLPSNKALTNADRIRAAANQQLAKLLYSNQKEFCRLMYKNLGFEDELNFSEDYSDNLAWLNAPSKEAEKALEAMKDE